MGLEMPDGDILRMLINQNADIAHIKTTVTRLDTIVGNGGGLVRKVDVNRELCDKREAEHQKDRREIWDYIRTHKGKVFAGGLLSAGTITGIVKGIEILWPIIHR